jgi:ATP-dependent DNA ligase
VKPDYLPTEDLDCLIVGGYFSQGMRKGGKITVWLLAVADEKDIDPDGHPKRFLTFCKVRRTSACSSRLTQSRNCKWAEVRDGVGFSPLW